MTIFKNIFKISSLLSNNLKTLRFQSITINFNKLTFLNQIISPSKKYFSIKSINHNDSNNNKSDFKNAFYYIANETLESLTEKFDSLADEYQDLFNDEYDVTYNNNVLTIKLGSKIGTYVLNTQTPNKQLWLSSPKSGPYRFDLINNKWVYKHTGETLHDLLTKEFSQFYNKPIDFSKCLYSGKNDDTK